jgi:hypothetical protein
MLLCQVNLKEDFENEKKQLKNIFFIAAILDLYFTLSPV